MSGQHGPTTLLPRLRDQQLEGAVEKIGNTVQVEADRPEEGALKRGDAGGCQALMDENSDAGVDYTYSTSTQVAWIMGGRNLAKKIKVLCVRCRFLRKQLKGQKMSSLPVEITVPCPPFTYVGVDLA